MVKTNRLLFLQGLFYAPSPNYYNYNLFMVIIISPF